MKFVSCNVEEIIQKLFACLKDYTMTGHIDKQSAIQ